MKVLFINSGIPGFSYRYAFDIHQTLSKDFNCTVHHFDPQFVSKKTICQLKPDLILVVHGTLTPPALIRYAGAHGIKTVLWLVEDPYEIDDHHRIIEAYDYVFTNEKEAVGAYHPASACVVSYLPWCCNPYVHKDFEVPAKYHSDLCFVGMGFPNRVRILNAIAPAIKDLNVKLIGDWETWGSLHPTLKDCVLPVVDDFLEVIKYYNGAKINLNIHRDPADPPSGNRKRIGAASPNDRVFALAGCGAFQLVDHTRPEVENCFQVGREIITFTDPEDLAEKIHEYLGNDRLRRSIGRAAAKRARREHTYKHRLAHIFRVVGGLRTGGAVAMDDPVWRGDSRARISRRAQAVSRGTGTSPIPRGDEG
ncbi:MAG TPA: glycosyltransferase [Bacillota bacterium]